MLLEGRIETTKRDFIANFGFDRVALNQQTLFLANCQVASLISERGERLYAS